MVLGWPFRELGLEGIINLRCGLELGYEQLLWEDSIGNLLETNGKRGENRKIGGSLLLNSVESNPA